ncbi:MAG: D-alanyl-D-alanine carboxypeptidase [Alphaproteobacteria bacterium]|nr:D-alanyl-D-alanine carboxypeptidase [Alphaproteobacteria bacterium]
MLKPVRRLFVSIGLAAAVAMTVTAPAAQAQIPYFRSLLAASESKYAAIVVDAKTGEVLYAKNADDPRYPASITKLMTLYLTFEALSSGKLHLSDRVVFSPHASAQAPTKLGVRPGDSVSVNTLVHAMVIKSANDAAVAMAEKLGGTESRFAALMTVRARELGMRNTHFADASGLPNSRQLTTARDLAILSRAIMRDYPQYYHLFSERSFDFRGHTIMGHNHMLNVPGVDGLKTGFTNASGFNIAVSGVRDGRRLIVIVMGGPSTALRDENAEDLLLTGFDVIKRRALGQDVTVAQNLYTPDLSGPVIRPPKEQGDADQDGVKIELTSAPAPRAHLRVEKHERHAVRRESWGVQVGEFRRHAEAREQIALVKRKFGRHFDGAEGLTERRGHIYKVVFTGFSKAEARGACRELHAHRLACMVVSPS